MKNFVFNFQALSIIIDNFKLLDYKNVVDFFDFNQFFNF